MSEHTTAPEPVRIGIVSISDRASSGVYEDKGLPALQEWLTRALKNPITFEPRLIPDEQDRISATLIELVDGKQVEPREAYMKAVDKAGFAGLLKARRHDVSFLGEA